MGNINVKILVLGLDNSGKSAVVNYLASKGTATSTVEPTTGYTLQDIKYSGGVTFTCWDVAGRENLRGLWKHYFDKTDALVWVIDSADKKRFDESVEWLRRVINEPDMQNCVILVLANKQDLPDAASKDEIRNLVAPMLGEKRVWHIEAVSVTQWKTMSAAFKWLSKTLKAKKKGQA